MIVDETLIRNVMNQYKIKDRRLAEELARQLCVYVESRGLEGHYKDLQKAFGADYAQRYLINKYRNQK